MHWKVVVLAIAAVLYFGVGKVLANRAHRHLTQKPPIWLEAPTIDPSLFDDEGKRRIAVMWKFNAVGAVLFVLLVVILNRI